MTDLWEFFPRHLGVNTAFVFYDHGIRESIDSFEQDQQIRFDLAYKAHDESGLPTDEEIKLIASINDKIEAFAKGSNGIYVGRVMSEGHCYYYCYSDASGEQIQEFIARVSDSTGHDLKSRTLIDPEKDGYWSDLFPTADDWRTIKDLKVVETLESAGDISDIVRRIDHWAFFKAKSDAKAFVAWLENEGFSIEMLKRTIPLIGDWTVQFYRSDSPQFFTINEITYKLRHQIENLDGEYDGWETSVETGEEIR